MNNSLNIIDQVEEFHERFDIPYYATPCLPRFKRTMRSNIMLEEVRELQQAMCDGDFVEIADAIADCMYVLVGTAWEHGLANLLPAILDEVHRSNMSKIGEDGKPIKRGDDKILKGPNFTPPNLKPILGLE